MKNNQESPGSWPASLLRLLTLGAMVLMAMGAANVATAAEAETDVMGAGNAQLEFKFGIQRDSAAALREKSTPFLARIGLTEAVELRLATDGRTVSTTANVTSPGWADASLGLRLRTSELDHRTGAPGMAWQFEFGLPSGSSALRAPSASTAVKFAAERALSEAVVLGVATGLVRQRNESNDWYVAPSLAVTLGKSWSPPLRTVVELVAPQWTSSANGGKVATANLGATYRLNDTWELEAVYSRGLTRTTPDHGLVMGLNIKF